MGRKKKQQAQRQDDYGRRVALSAFKKSIFNRGREQRKGRQSDPEIPSATRTDPT